MVRFETLYGRKCRSSIFLYELGENKEFETDYIKEQQKMIDVFKID
jgi:hypothetical protein